MIRIKYKTFFAMALGMAICCHLYAYPFPFPDRTWDMFHYGFEMDVSQAGWILTAPQQYTLPENKGELNWRIVPTEQRPLSVLAQEWKKQYIQLGFRIESSNVSEASAVFDLNHPEQKKRLRQVIIKSSKYMLLMTCTALREDYAFALAKCSSTWQSFRWLDSADKIVKSVGKIKANRVGASTQPSLLQNK